MKRRVIIKASKNVRDIISSIPDDEFSRMSKAERRIIARAQGSTDTQVYLAGAAEAMELVGADVTDAFIDFYNRVLEGWEFSDDDVTGATKLTEADPYPKGFPIMYDKEAEYFYANYEGHIFHSDDVEELANVLIELNADPSKFDKYKAARL